MALMPCVPDAVTVAGWVRLISIAEHEALLFTR